MATMHSLLTQQIERHLGHAEKIPTDYQALFNEVDKTYQSFDAAREREANARFLHELTEATRLLVDPAQIMAVMARLLGEKLHASRCAYADVEADSEHFTILHDYTDGCATTVGRYQLSLFGAQAVSLLNQGQTLVIRNVQAELLPDQGADMFNAIGIQAIVTCPLVKETGLRAMMAVHQTTPRDWTAAEISLVQEVVERCWATILRRTSEEKLRQSETLLKIAGRTARLGGWTVEVPDIRVTFSDEVYAIFELPPGTVCQFEEAIGFFTPESQKIARHAFGVCTQQGTPFDLELELVSTKGRRAWVRVIVEAERNSAGTITRVQGAMQDITERKLAALHLEEMHAQLLAASRQAGMAEFATGILHNVGNVLNSVNIASTCVADSLKKSKAGSLAKVVALLSSHENDLGDFLTHDPKGRMVPEFLRNLAEQFSRDQTEALAELAELQKNIEHIKDIVTTQQGMAKTAGASEAIEVGALVEDALRMNLTSATHPGITINQEADNLPPILADRSKALQILVNLVRNARQSCAASHQIEQKLAIHTAAGDGRVRIAVTDNGVGIPPENLARIFTHGFTTKKDGHGFGLHSAVAAAKEMGGSLTARSDGVGLGATFVLELPCQARSPAGTDHAL